MTDTKIDDKICSMGLSRVYLMTCFDGLKDLLSQREYFLKEAREILDKVQLELYDANEKVFEEYCAFRDAYYNLLDIEGLK